MREATLFFWLIFPKKLKVRKNTTIFRYYMWFGYGQV